MGDISAEPSMEEILSSIKRIIAEEGEGTQARTRRPARAATTVVPPAADPDPEPDEVLELSEPMSPPATPPQPQAHPEPAAAVEPPATILSQQAVAASRDSLDTLSKLVAQPETATAPTPVPAGDGALDAVVREMLRPMLREWLDTHLPGMVEAMVAREIAKITGQR